jgi:hypothetical protein
MEILIHENAANNYFRRCYRGTQPNAVGLHNEGFYNILKGLQGKWVEVDTTHLFTDQFNTVVIEGVTGSGARINLADVVEIKDDVRHGLQKCVWCYGYDHNHDGLCDRCEQSKYLVDLISPVLQSNIKGGII